MGFPYLLGFARRSLGARQLQLTDKALKKALQQKAAWQSNTCPRKVGISLGHSCTGCPVPLIPLPESSRNSHVRIYCLLPYFLFIYYFFLVFLHWLSDILAPGSVPSLEKKKKIKQSKRNNSKKKKKVSFSHVSFNHVLFILSLHLIKPFASNEGSAAHFLHPARGFSVHGAG